VGGAAVPTYHRPVVLVGGLGTRVGNGKAEPTVEAAQSNRHQNSPGAAKPKDYTSTLTSRCWEAHRGVSPSHTPPASNFDAYLSE
jgi:hypothetical protein